jgi:hypothetical protein
VHLRQSQGCICSSKTQGRVSTRQGAGRCEELYGGVGLGQMHAGLARSLGAQVSSASICDTTATNPAYGCIRLSPPSLPRQCRPSAPISSFHAKEKLGEHSTCISDTAATNMPVPAGARTLERVPLLNQSASRPRGPDAGGSRKSSFLFAWNRLILNALQFDSPPTAPPANAAPPLPYRSSALLLALAPPARGRSSAQLLQLRSLHSAPPWRVHTTPDVLF